MKQVPTNWAVLHYCFQEEQFLLFKFLQKSAIHILKVKKYFLYFLIIGQIQIMCQITQRAITLKSY